MAIPMGVFSSFLPVDRMCFFKPSSAAIIRPVSANVRLSRSVTISAAASKPSTAETKSREPRGIMKPRRVSPEMQEFLGGVSEIPRTKVLKEIWAHIKLHNLQDPEDKKIIICDEKLKTIFVGKDRVGFLEIAGLITPHFLK